MMGSKVELACVTAEEFSLVYYKSMDKSRHALGRLYTDSALLSWCGHGHLGPDRIQSFLLSLPPTEFTVSTLDAHPLADDTLPSSNQGTFLVQVTGQVKYLSTDQPLSGGKEPPEKAFQQTFMITAQGDKWKIVSDCFRLQGAINKS